MRLSGLLRPPTFQAMIPRCSSLHHFRSPTLLSPMSSSTPSHTPASTPPSSSSSTQHTPTADRQTHNAFQADYFTRELPALQASITPKVEAKLAAIAASIPGLGPSSRVLDVGAGDGALIPHLQRQGVADVVAVDVCPAMIDALHQRFGESLPSTLGNEPSVRAWIGDVVDLPAFYGPFDAVFFNAVFGNLADPRDALLKACFLLRPGGWVVVSHPLGRKWHQEYALANPQLVPHALPRKDDLDRMLADLPLELISFKDDSELYVATMRIPEGFAHPAAPIQLAGEVVAGFGRGSKQLGVPTANLAPGPLAEKLQGLPSGVYFGWARLEVGPGAPPEDSAVHEMVMNVGRRPTFSDDTNPEVSVEVHIMHAFAAEDFHGRTLRVVALGYLRPEIRFSGIQALMARIAADIGLARSQLDGQRWTAYKTDPFLLP